MELPAALAEVIARWTAADGTIGVFLTGSSVRPYRDEWSDLDVQIAVEDRVYSTLDAAAKVAVAVGVAGAGERPVRRKEWEVLVRPWSELAGFATSTWDMHHFKYRFAEVVFDPRGELAALFAQLATLPAELREPRMRVHYFDFLFARSKAVGFLRRNNRSAARLMVADAAIAATKLVFAIESSWAPERHWALAELALAAPGPLPTALAQVIDAPDETALLDLQRALDRHLVARGESFHTSREALWHWVLSTDDGRAARRLWGSR